MELLWIFTASVLILHTGLQAEVSIQVKKSLEAFCPKGWYSFGDLCYKGFQDRMNFDEAEGKCVERGGHLVVISSSDVQEYVVSVILLELEHRAYIGLRHNESSLAMHWTDGSELDFRDWDANEPSQKSPGGDAEHCVEMTFVDILDRLGKWNDISCSQKIPYICQKEKGFEGEEPEKDPIYCPWSVDGLHLQKKSCYHFSVHLKSWEDAEKYCVEQYGGHLAAVTDVAVQKFLNYSMATQTTAQERMWIGIRLQPDEVFLWSSGWYVGYTNWIGKSAYPKVSSESCGAMVKGSGLWDLRSCDEPLSFICENSSVIPPPKLNSTTDGLTCPPEERDWIDLGGDRCYIFDTTTHVSWYHANFMCMRKGGTLASIHSESEERVLEQFVRYSQVDLHIGLFRHDRNQADGEFRWADHSVVDYTNWRYGEPNSKDEMCAEVIPFQKMNWNDKNCGTAGGFICSIFKVYSDRSSTTQQTMEDLKENKKDQCECLPTPAIVGVVLCVLLVIVLIAVVLYNVNPWRKDKKDSAKRKSSLVTQKPRYRTGERVISEAIYENEY